MNLELQLVEDPELNINYDFIQKIGQGCFGKLYKVRNKQFKIFTALKVQLNTNNYSTKSKLSLLQHQAHILLKLQGKPFTPKLYAYGTWKHGLFIQLQLLSKDLSHLIPKQLRFDQLSMIMIRLLHSIIILHQSQIIHQDIKPQNIMINLKGELIFIDFGNSNILQKFDISNIQNINRRINGFIGTPRYASIQAHNHLYQSKKDDLQGLMYMMAFLYLKKLPWMDLKASPSKKFKLINRLKQLKGPDTMKLVGRSFEAAYQYIRELESMQEPNYNYLIYLFRHNSNTMRVLPKLEQEGQVKKAGQKKKTQNGRCQIGLNTCFYENLLKEKSLMRLNEKMQSEQSKFLQLIGNRLPVKLSTVQTTSTNNTLNVRNINSSTSCFNSKNISAYVYNECQTQEQQYYEQKQLQQQQQQQSPDDNNSMIMIMTIKKDTIKQIHNSNNNTNNKVNQYGKEQQNKKLNELFNINIMDQGEINCLDQINQTLIPLKMKNTFQQ